MHLHPDRHNGDEAAFKELSQAYAQLASENAPLTPEEAQTLFFQLFGADGDFGALWRVDGRSQRKAKSWQDYQALLDTGDSAAVTSGREARQLYRQCLRALRGVDAVTADGVRAHARSLFALHADETDLTLLRNLLVDGRASLDEMISCLGTAVAEPPPPPSTPRRATAVQGAARRANGASRGFASSARGGGLGAALRGMRVDYEAKSLDEATCGDEPLALFRTWLDAAVAAKLPEPNAMALATVDPQTLQPSTRVVLLKGIDDDAFQFYTNYSSRKARELDAAGRAALTLVWLPLERQVRVEGTVCRLSAEESAAYFLSRPRASQIGAWVSRQSEAIASAEELREREEELTARFEGKDVPVPPFWGGYRLTPGMIEFWQGRQSRLHDRVEFRRGSGGEWARRRLCP